jgi:Carboxypeptidase regulatory-like domain
MFKTFSRGLTAPRLGRVAALLVVSLMSVFLRTAQAQVSTASLNGTVMDNTGAVIPGAKVLVLQTETNFKSETTSGQDGSFSISSIPVGPYVLSVTRDGFAHYKQEGIVLTVGQVASFQISLTIGAATQDIVVTAETSAVESTDSTIQDVVEQKVVEDLPLNGRNPAALVYTAPGVTDALINPTGTNANSSVAPNASLLGESAPTANGVRPGGTYFSLDGATNVDPLAVVGGPFPNPDATQEFSVVTGSYGARYVSAPGGAVNIVTKSGTNQIHGSAFEFVRNGAFNAENAFATAPDTLKRNQFGFAAGGPILRDRLFAFGSYQQTLIRAQNLINGVVGLVTPTENQQKGQFKSAITGDIVTVPISTVAGNLLRYIPPPNYTPPGGELTNYNTTTPNKTDNPQWVAKVDYDFGKHRLFARYFANHQNTPADPMEASSQTESGFDVLTASPGNEGRWDTFALGDTWSLKSWVVDARASYVKANVAQTTASNLDSLSIAGLGATGVSVSTQPTLPTFYAFGSLFVSGGTPSKETTTSWDYSVDVLHSFGKHELGFGTDFRFVALNQASLEGQNPSYVFAGLHTLFLGPGPLDNNGFADFLEGYPFEDLQGDGTFSSVNGHLFGLYMQDKYRATNRLTVTGGLRWDPYFPYTPKNNQIDCFNPGQQSQVYTNAPKGLIYPGDPGCSKGGTSAKYGLIQPRLGLAYRLDSAGNSAIRAGYGLYSTQFQLESLNGFSAPPFVRSFLIENIPFGFQNIDAPWTSIGQPDPFAAGFHDANYKPPSDVSFAAAESIGFADSAIDKNFQPAYTQQWSLSLQHAFTRSDSMEIAYIGTEGVHIAQSYDANLPVYNGNAKSPGATRPYGSEGLTQILTLVSNSTSNYHGLNATYRHHGAGGLDLMSAFNWSKCLDDGSQPAVTSGLFGATGESNNLVANGAYLPHARYGRCDFDQNLTSRTTLVWSLPALKSESNLVRTVAGSWTMSGLVVADAGQPFSVTDAAGLSETGLNLDLANRVPGVPVYLNGKLNIAAFTNNAPGTYGDSGRNSFRSPTYVHVDPAIMKSFPIFPDKVRLLFRAEAFNVFNHPNKYPPASEFNTPSTFGLTTAARDPRILQLSMKLSF